MRGVTVVWHRNKGIIIWVACGSIGQAVITFLHVTGTIR